MAKEHVLVTGAAGLIGSHFTTYLLDNGYQVSAVDDLSGGYEDFVDKRASFHLLNISDPIKLDGIFGDNPPDYVYHFAAYAAEGLSHFIRGYNYTNNVISSVNVINACIRHKVRKLIFTSSMAVYGTNTLPFTEDLTPHPEDPYGIAKLAIEQDLHCAYDQFGLRYSIVRPHNVIGIHQNIWDRYRNVIGIWIRQAIDGQPLSIYGDGLQRRAFSDVMFLLRPLEQLMHGFDGEVFNFGSDQSISIVEAADVVHQVARRYGIECKVNFLEKRNEVKHAFSSQEKAKRLLNFSDNTDLVKVVDEMFVWAKNQPKRHIRDMRYEIDRGMYTFWKV